MAKYLDGSGLTYLWQKIKAAFADINHNHDGVYVDAASGTTSGHVVKFGANGHTIVDSGLTILQSVPASTEAGFISVADQQKLKGIADGAEVNVQADWNETDNSDDAFIKNKPENLVQDASYVHTDNNYTTDEKNKLKGIAAGAEVNVQADWNETDKSKDEFIKNKPANLVQDASYVHTDNNYTTNEKNKLAGIAEGAQVNAVEGVKEGENIISLTSGKLLQSTLGIAIERGAEGSADEGKTFIKLTGINGAQVARVDASEFVVDGMLKSTGIYTKSSSGWTPSTPTGGDVPTKNGTYIRFEWNVDGGSKVEYLDVTKLVDVYTADGQGLILTDHQFSLSFDNSGNVQFTKSASGLKATVDLSGKADADHNHDSVYVKKSTVTVPETIPAPNYGETATIGSVDGKDFKITIPAAAEAHSALSNAEIDAAIAAANPA
jgi:hypothetical protein